MEQLIPFKEILSNPNTAWALLAIILVIYVMRDGNTREIRLTNIIDTTLKEHGQLISQQTATLTNVNNSLLNLQSRVEEVEENIGLKGGTLS